MPRPATIWSVPTCVWRSALPGAMPAGAWTWLTSSPRAISACSVPPRASIPVWAPASRPMPATGSSKPFSAPSSASRPVSRAGVCRPVVASCAGPRHDCTRNWDGRRRWRKWPLLSVSPRQFQIACQALRAHAGPAQSDEGGPGLNEVLPDRRGGEPGVFWERPRSWTASSECWTGWTRALPRCCVCASDWTAASR